jgi:hypothetical protein
LDQIIKFDLQVCAMNQLILSILFALLVPTATAAGAPDACDEDRAKFCKAIMDAGGKVGACLDQHLNDLSQGCKAEREAKAEEKAKKKQTPPSEQKSE